MGLLWAQILVVTSYYWSTNAYGEEKIRKYIRRCKMLIVMLLLIERDYRLLKVKTAVKIDSR